MQYDFNLARTPFSPLLTRCIKIFLLLNAYSFSENVSTEEIPGQFNYFKMVNIFLSFFYCSV